MKRVIALSHHDPRYQGRNPLSRMGQRVCGVSDDMEQTARPDGTVQINPRGNFDDEFVAAYS